MHLQTEYMGLELQEMYSFYGDSAYGGFYHCIRKKHTRATGQVALTAREVSENHIMEKTREKIEWSYALNKNLWGESYNKKGKKLDKNADIVNAVIRLQHLFTNIYVCIHGSQIRKKILLDPPTLEEYLNMIKIIYIIE